MGENEFKTLKSILAKHGHTLHRSGEAQTPQTFWATRWGMVRELPTPGDVRQFVRQIGGAPAREN